MALLAKEKYDSAKVEKLLDLLLFNAEKGRPMDYEIIVDGFKTVRRTNDPNEFMDFSRFVDANTKVVELVFFTGTSNNNDRYIFTLTDTGSESLGSIDIDTKVAEQVERREKAWKFAVLEKEHADLKGDYAALEKELESLEVENKALREHQSPLKGILGEIGSTFVESFIRRNPAIMKSIPGGEALSGIINGPGHGHDTSSEGSVSFQPKSDTRDLTEDEQAAVSFVEQLKIQFSKDEFDRVVLVLQWLAEDKRRIETVINTGVTNRL